MTLACRVWNEDSFAQERVTFQIRCFHVSVSSFLPRREPWKQTVAEVGERPCRWHSGFENCGTQQILRHEEGAEVLGRTDELGRRDGYTACTHGRNGRPAIHPTTPKSASVSSEVHQL